LKNKTTKKGLRQVWKDSTSKKDIVKNVVIESCLFCVLYSSIIFIAIYFKYLGFTNIGASILFIIINWVLICRRALKDESEKQALTLENQMYRTL